MKSSSESYQNTTFYEKSETWDESSKMGKLIDLKMDVGEGISIEMYKSVNGLGEINLERNPVVSASNVGVLIW